MTISLRQDQFDALAAAHLAGFRQRALLHVAKCWPREADALGAHGLRARVEQAIEEAQARELRAERDIIVFIDLLFLLGLQDSGTAWPPWIEGIFADPLLAPSTKLHLVWDRATAGVRASGKREQL